MVKGFVVRARQWNRDSVATQSAPMARPRHRYPGYGQRMKAALDAMGSNMHELAQRMKVAYTTVYHWYDESSTPSAYMIERTAKELGVSEQFLKYGTTGIDKPAAHPSLVAFVETQGCTPEEREHLSSIAISWDPGEDYWLSVLAAYRSAKRVAAVPVKTARTR